MEQTAENESPKICRSSSELAIRREKGTAGDLIFIDGDLSKQEAPRGIPMQQKTFWAPLINRVAFMVPAGVTKEFGRDPFLKTLGPRQVGSCAACF